MTQTNDLDIKTIKSIFLKYDLGPIKCAPEKITGDVDLHYKITAESGDVFLLKYIVNKEHLKKFEFLGSVYRYLNEKGIPVPFVYKSKNDNFIEDDCILYRYIDGEIKTAWSDNEIISIVNNFAKLLIALRDYKVPDFIKNNNDKYAKGYNIRYCYEIFRPMILKLQISENLKTLIIEVIDIMYSKLADFEKLPKQLIHGDLNEMNAIFKNGLNVGIIDFGVSYDPIVYDLGEFCYWFALPWKTNIFKEDRYALIIKTFEKILPLSCLERDLLPYMVLRRNMMDIMLALQHYWSNPNLPVPIESLEEKVSRKMSIISFMNKE